MTPRIRPFRRRPAMLPGLLISTAGVAASVPAALADTQTVTVGVTFIERIEVTARSAQSPVSQESGIVVAGAVADAADPSAPDPILGREPALAVLSVQGTPGRVMTLQVDAPDAGTAAALRCSYASLPLTACSGNGLTAVSAADAELTIARAPVDAGDAIRPVPAAAEPSAIEVMIVYQ